MQEKNVTVLDFTGCKYVVDLHNRIREALEFPEWYGRNWDALWDCLIMEMPEEISDVEIRGLNSLPADLKSGGEMIVELMQKCKDHHDEYLKKHPDYGCCFDFRIVD